MEWKYQVAENRNTTIVPECDCVMAKWGQHLSEVGTTTAAVWSTLSGVSVSVCLCTLFKVQEGLLIWFICHYTTQGCIMRGTFVNPVNPHKKSRQFFFTNIHVSVVHFLNLHLSESEQQQQDGDNSVVPCSGLPGQVRWLKESMGNKVSDCNTLSQLQKLRWPIRDKKLLF